MDTFNPPTQRQRLRNELVEFALGRVRSHWVTLNTHRNLTTDDAFKRLKRWRVELMRRLHGHRWYELPETERFEFFGTREFTKMGEPHFHLVCSVPRPLTNRFDHNAVRRWKAIVPSGTCHIDPIDDQADSSRRVVGYCLKWLDTQSDLPFVDSRLIR